jgi:hypothetical protein
MIEDHRQQCQALVDGSGAGERLVASPSLGEPGWAGPVEVFAPDGDCLAGAADVGAPEKTRRLLEEPSVRCAPKPRRSTRAALLAHREAWRIQLTT